MSLNPCNMNSMIALMPEPETVCLRDALQAARSTLQDCSDTPETDAQWLWGHALQRNQAWLLAHPEYRPTTTQQNRGEYLIHQRQQGHSVAHLCGYSGFMDFTLRLNHHALAPRPETETLVAEALPLLPYRARVLEWGTGSGALAIAIAKARPDCTILALDCAQTNLRLAHRNALTLRVHNIQFAWGDWNQNAYWPQTRFDLILANPPYIAPHNACLQSPGVCREPRRALVSTNSGLQAIYAIAGRAKKNIRRNGWLLMEHGSGQDERCRRILQQAGWGRVRSISDWSGIPRAVCAHQ